MRSILVSNEFLYYLGIDAQYKRKFGLMKDEFYAFEQAHCLFGKAAVKVINENDNLWLLDVFVMGQLAQLVECVEIKAAGHQCVLGHGLVAFDHVFHRSADLQFSQKGHSQLALH